MMHISLVESVHRLIKWAVVKMSKISLSEDIYYMAIHILIASVHYINYQVFYNTMTS